MRLVGCNCSGQPPRSQGRNTDRHYYDCVLACIFMGSSLLVAGANRHHGSGLPSRKEAAGWAALRQCRCPYDTCSALRDRDPPGTASGELAIWRSLKAQRHASLKLRTSEVLDQTLTTTLPI